MKTITARELHGILLAQPETTVLDVRTPVEYDALNVAGTRNVPLTSLRPRELFEQGEPAKVRPIYVLCQSGTRARLAAEQLAAEGFTNAVVVEGGVRAWQGAGLPLEAGKTGAISLERQVRIAAGTLVLLGLSLAYFVHPWFAGLSAFVGAGLVFAGLSDWCGMGLLLARAPWNQRRAG